MMQTAFDMGDKVFISALVKKIDIGEDGKVSYKLEIESELTEEVSVWMYESELMLKQKGRRPDGN